MEELNRIIQKHVALKRDKRCHSFRESSFLSTKRHGLFIYLYILHKVSLLLKPNYILKNLLLTQTCPHLAGHFGNY